MKFVGIVGAEEAKFTRVAAARARLLIRQKLIRADTCVVSGACPLGGVDAWAEEIADELRVPKLIFPPAEDSWEGGFKARNIQIAEASDIVHVLVVDRYPPDFAGRRFKSCYHCVGQRPELVHVKSGACWTAQRALDLGKQAQWHVLPNQGP